VLAGVIVFIGLVFAFLLWRLIRYGNNVAAAQKIRAAAVAICVWNFSPDEWLDYAAGAEFIKDPKGPGEIKITIYDIWIKDDGGTRTRSLNAKRLVTDCRVDSRGIKVRRRSVNIIRTTPVYEVRDLYIPVPSGKEGDAAKVVDRLKAFIAEHSDKVAWVTPPDVLNGLMGEVDF
jgi:hypothetical protein